jgi:hypothetical protein
MRLSTSLGHVWQPTAQHQTVRMRCQLYEDCDADFFASQFRIATSYFQVNCLNLQVMDKLNSPKVSRPFTRQ